WISGATNGDYSAAGRSNTGFGRNVFRYFAFAPDEVYHRLRQLVVMPLEREAVDTGQLRGVRTLVVILVHPEPSQASFPPWGRHGNITLFRHLVRWSVRRQREVTDIERQALESLPEQVDLGGFVEILEQVVGRIECHSSTSAAWGAAVIRRVVDRLV